MAKAINRKEWSDRVEQDAKNLELRLAELRMIGADNGREDEYFHTRDMIERARQLLNLASYSIFGLEIGEGEISVFEGENNEQQETSNTSEAEGK